MIKHRTAAPEDNQQLINLTAAAGMTGEISLRIDRKPDFFKLLDIRGETKVFVALDGETIVGSICVSLQQVYVGGEIYPLQYIGDFKVAEEYRSKGIGLQLCNNVADYVISNNSDLAFLNVSKGNNRPFSFFKNRPNIPDFDNIGIFKIHQFIGKKIKHIPADYNIQKTEITDEVVLFLNEHYSRYELGTFITKEKLKDAQVYKIQQNNIIIAVMCLVDTMHLKQNVVTKISWKMKALLKAMNFFYGFAGISKMPTLNEPVRMMYIKYLAVNNAEQKLVKYLINYARDIVYRKSYSFVSMGLHEKDPLHSSFKGLLKITFKSVGMLLSIKNSRPLIEKVKKGIPFEDYSLV
ncbi:MAG: GNAT family N-acetyltransferase [Ginsengibacter sp.]